MQLSTNAAIAALTVLIRESLPEIRERCAETTFLKLSALTGDVETLAAAEPVSGDASAAVPIVSAEAVANAVAERLGVEVSSALNAVFDARDLEAAAVAAAAAQPVA